MPSNMRCAVCGGFGGEWGDAHGVGPMCYDCWVKAGKPNGLIPLFRYYLGSSFC